MLYTVMPMELVLANNQEVLSVEEVQLDGVLMLVELSERGTRKIVRLVSTDPQVYLDPRFTPGTLVPSG